MHTWCESGRLGARGAGRWGTIVCRMIAGSSGCRNRSSEFDSYTFRMAGMIMIVEDEPAVARGVQVALEREGYEVSVQATGEDALANFADAAPDLVVLDVRLPGIDGFEVLRQLRRETRAPVLFLTARADDVDKVLGLEMGADDYLVKPFSVKRPE